jgi:hypothetical protein
VWSAECKLQSVEWGVASVKCEVKSVELGV